MRKAPQPGPRDHPLCFHTNGDPDADFGIYCVCFQGYDGKGSWRVYVDRNGVAYTRWKIFAGNPF